MKGKKKSFLPNAFHDVAGMIRSNSLDALVAVAAQIAMPEDAAALLEDLPSNKKNPLDAFAVN